MKNLRINIVGVFQVVFILFSAPLNAQHSDTTVIRSETLNNDLEDLARASNGAMDYSDLVDEYQFYVSHPININGSNIDKLVELRLLNEAQLFSIQSYLKHEGPILSLYELKYVPGISRGTLKRLANYIVAGKAEGAKKIPWKRIIKRGRQQFLIRYGQVLEPVSGYSIPPDSAYLKPGSVYLGTPQKLYFRYSFNAENRFRVGITTEKDAGEVFLKRSFGDSVNALLEHRPPFPDFISAYAFASGIGILKKAIIGDYHLEFGQGLTLWSGLTFGKSSQACQVKYFGRGIRPNTSVNENRFFRGLAFTLQKNDFQFTAFYSKKKYDGNLLPPDSSGIRTVSSLLETGYHRTINELLDKNAVDIAVYGGRLAFHHKRLQIGAIYYQTHLNHSLKDDKIPYRLFYFHGKHLSNFGLNMNLSLMPLSFFGEVAANPGGKFAGLAGFNTFLSDRFTMTLYYRNFSRNYQALFASPFRESSRVGNEQGIYLGLKALLTKAITLSGYADYYSFPWLKYQVDRPSKGRAYLLHLDVVVNQRLSVYFRFRFNRKDQNFSDGSVYLSYPEPRKRYDFRYGTSYALFNFLWLKNRIEYVMFQENNIHEHGFLIFQDILLRRGSFPLQVSFRYALFNSSGWNSRIYTYENDVLYAFSVPALYGHGQRIYLLLNWSKVKNLKMWLRGATTIFFDRAKLGSGAEAINTNHKSTVTLQLQWKF